MSTTIERLLETLKDESAEATKQYIALAKSIAAGEEVRPQKVRAILTAAHKKTEDLQRDVSLAEQRAAWRAALARLPELERELTAVNGQIDKADEELEAAVERHRTFHAEILPRRDQLRAEIAAARDARRALLSQFIPGDGIGAELKRARAALEEATLRAAELRAAIAEAEQQAKSAATEAARPMMSRPRRWADETERCERRAARLHDELKAAEASIVELERRVSEAERAALEE